MALCCGDTIFYTFMKLLQIYTDVALTEAATGLLREGAAPHRVVTTGLAEAEVAFGQPALADLAAAPRVRWVQVSSAGYTRYDTAEFRAAAAARGLALTNSSGVYAHW